MRAALILASLLLVISTSCKKPGPGGKSRVYGKVLYNGSPVTNAIVYIKYGSSDKPGVNPSDYDNQQTVDGGGNYNFGGMARGDYFLYATGYTENEFNQQIAIKGEVSIHLARKQNIEYNITLHQ